MSDFTDALRLYFDKLSVAKYNFEELKSLGSSKLVNLLFIQVEMQRTPHQTMLVASVMLTCILRQEVGMCTGAIGVVEHLLFHPDRLPPYLAIAALVELANYSVPVFSNKP